MARDIKNKDYIQRRKVSKDKEETKIQGVSLGDINHAGGWAAVDVKNGKIVRIRPFHYDSKYPDFRTWSIEARGKRFESSNKSLLSPIALAYKKRIYSPNRIKYPLKRVDWDPNGDRNPQNRGRSKFKRISWEEATDIMASEITRLRQKYGPEAVGLSETGHGETKTLHASHGMNNFLMDCLGQGGDFTLLVCSPISWEGSTWGSKHVWGFEPFGEEPANIKMLIDIARNTEMILYWPCDVESLGWLYGSQQSGRICAFWKEVGIESVFISPDFNATAAVHADKWIPVLPNTDAALLLAIAYVWMREGTYDKEYIATHTYGYDRFEDYVLGREDGVPKTPAWASPICAVPEWTIKALARKWASRVTSTAANHGGGMVRGVYSHEMMRLQVLLLAMQGVGKPGVHQAMMIHLMGFQIEAGMQKRDRLTTVAGYRCAAVTEFKSGAPARQAMFRNRLADCILNPPVTWRAGVIAKREDQFREHRYPKEGCSEVHMLWSDCPCSITCGSAGNKQIEALRSPKLEFIVMQHPWLENECLYADLLLPISTKFELDDIGYEDFEFSALYLENKCVEPVGESKSDYEALIPLAENLGVKDKFTGRMTIEEWQKYTFEKSGAQKLISWQEFKDKGYVISDSFSASAEGKPELQLFYDDPKAHPLRTPTGLIEFESKGLKEHFPDDKERPPVPHYIAEGITHQESLSSERARKYPLLLMSTPPRFRIHTQGDDISWTREIYKVKGPDGYMYEPAWLHPTTAAGRGIENGDIVKVYNERGAVLAGAVVTERILPGAVRLDHGARHDPIIPGELDRGGSSNAISPTNVISRNADGFVLTGYLIEMEKVTRAQMEEWRQKYPEAFEREYDPASGLCSDAWIEKNS